MLSTGGMGKDSIFALFILVMKALHDCMVSVLIRFIEVNQFCFAFLILGLLLMDLIFSACFAFIYYGV